VDSAQYSPAAFPAGPEFGMSRQPHQAAPTLEDITLSIKGWLKYCSLPNHTSESFLSLVAYIFLHVVFGYVQKRI